MTTRCNCACYGPAPCERHDERSALRREIADLKATVRDLKATVRHQCTDDCSSYLIIMFSDGSFFDIDDKMNGQRTQCAPIATNISLLSTSRINEILQARPGKMVRAEFHVVDID